MEAKKTSLNKYISQTGVCSRRVADSWIEEGRVLVNDQKAHKGMRVDEQDLVSVDGKVIGKVKNNVYIALNKPVGVTCTTDLKDKSNIIDFLNYPERIFPIGRLDKPSTGLILLTNNGDIVNPILREANHHEKEYVVSVNKPITKSFLKQMSKGVPILDTITKPCDLVQKSKFTFHVTLTQGLNRQIRRMCKYFDYEVTSLHRIRIMHINIGSLKMGDWRYLSPDEVKLLSEQIT